MGDVIDTEEYQGYTIDIVHDSDAFACNPRENDNVGTLITWERDYSSPDDNPFTMHDRNPEYRTDAGYDPDDGTFLAYRAQRRRDRKSKDDGLIVVALSREPYNGALQAIDYTAHCYNLGAYPQYHNPLRDAVHIEGVAYVTDEDARREWGEGKRKVLTAKARQLALDCLKAEIEEYSDWAIGNVHGFVIRDATDDNIDSCWGFIGDSDGYVLDAAKEAVDCRIAGGRLANLGVDDDDAEEDMDEEIAEYAAQYPNIAAD